VPAPDVAAVVVAHNSAGLLPGCVAAVATAASRVQARVLVVDSGSTDGVERLCAELNVAFLPGPNQGLSAAFNRALTHDAVRQARYVLQLNPDVSLPPGGLDELVGLADRRPGCGILAPRQVDQRGELIFSIGVEPSPADYWRGFTALRCDWVWDPARYAREGSADWVMGACMLLRGEMLAAIGGFDERFFLCSEEVDLCRRARLAGWSVDYTPRVTVVHPLADRPIDAHRVRLEEWSRILYIRKWHGPLSRLSMRLALAARFARLAAIEGSYGRCGDARLRLEATLRFRRRRYGAAPPAS
jgi:N-acetylglucosaminyl-diphospho-decaprenol L-rhamnosyltransferase